MRIRFIQAEGGICIYLRGFQETMEPLRSIGGSRLYYYNFIYDFLPRFIAFTMFIPTEDISVHSISINYKKERKWRAGLSYKNAICTWSTSSAMKVLALAAACRRGRWETGSDPGSPGESFLRFDESEDDFAGRGSASGLLVGSQLSYSSTDTPTLSSSMVNFSRSFSFCFSTLMIMSAVLPSLSG